MLQVYIWHDETGKHVVTEEGSRVGERGLEHISGISSKDTVTELLEIDSVNR